MWHRSLRVALLSAEVLVGFGPLFWPWLGAVIMFFGHLWFALAEASAIEWSGLLFFAVTAVFGGCGLWGIVLLYFNAAFDYKAYENFREPFLHGSLGVVAWLTVLAVLPAGPQWYAVIPPAVFLHLLWLNR